MLQFEYRPDLPYFAYFPENGMTQYEQYVYKIWKTPTITYPSYRIKADWFALLHEQGHHFHKHGMNSKNISEYDEVTAEIEAWSYALECVKPKYYTELMAQAIYIIEYSYSRKSSERAQKYLIEYIAKLTNL